MARLTVSVEDETVERLRALAGGERKVGSYLDEVTSWLWENYETTGQVAIKDYPLRSAGDVFDELDTMRARLDATEDAMRQILEKVAQSASMLQAQEDSGQNDA